MRAVFSTCSLAASLTLAASVSADGQISADSVVRFRSHPESRILPRTGVTTAVMVGTAALSFLDDDLAHEARRVRDESSPGTRQAMHLTSSIGGYLPLAVGGSLVVTGWVFHSDFTRTLGMDVTSAVVASGLVTAVVKGAVGRARPRMVAESDEYFPGRGFTNNSLASFPSGHSSAAFAGATVLASELAKKHPRQATWIRVGLYGAAAAIGLSRMYENAHWASDVFAGAAIGTMSGLAIVHHRFPIR